MNFVFNLSNVVPSKELEEVAKRQGLIIMPLPYNLQGLWDKIPETGVKRHLEPIIDFLVNDAKNHNTLVLIDGGDPRAIFYIFSVVGSDRCLVPFRGSELGANPIVGKDVAPIVKLISYNG